MTYEFYGPTSDAVLKINALLGFSATGREQDWEIEFSSPMRVREMLDFLVRGNFDDEIQTALALLMLASMDEANTVDLEDQDRVIQWFSANERIRKKMQFYWIHLDRAASPKIIDKILGVN